MKGLCDARGIGFLVAVLPRRDQVSGGHVGRAYNDRTLGITQAYGISGLDLLPPLAAEYRVHGARLFIPWDGHNGAEANRVIATEIANAVPTLITARASGPAPTIAR